MKLTIKILNSSKENVSIYFEPTGDYKSISSKNDFYLEVDQINTHEPLTIEITNDGLIFEENNSVHTDLPNDC